MSSPFAGGNYGYHDRAAISSPGIGPRADPVQGPEDVSVRSMRLKVLYTFDDLNKTNCLARWPQALDIRSVFLDETTQIGVVELKTCIQAIVSASPELVAKLGQDYTVYAYDYSEYDTPLVGQGMLSWVLASPSGPAAPANSTRTLVTGRVCRNILGLFSSSSHETLEVKLRLVPVPSCSQSEYIESMKTYRDLSKIMPEGFDAGAWTSFLQANPCVGQLTQPARRQAGTSKLGQQALAEPEHVPRLVSQDSSRRGSVDLRYNPPTENSSATEPLQIQPRAASPALSARSATAPSKRRGRPPRTASRTSMRGRDTQLAPLSSRDTMDNMREPEDDQVEDGPVKKRAKVSRVERPDSTGFDKLPDSLRVAASAAASVRIHQPAAVRPPIAGAPALEGPPRAPTPIADPSNIIRRSRLPKARSNLREQSPLADEMEYKSPYVGSESLQQPEERNIGSLPNTPAEIPSSPPIYRGSTTHSSPHLPTLPTHMDSGFMSGTIEGLLEDDEYRTPDEDDLVIAAQYSRALGLPEPIIENMDESHLFTPTSPVAHPIPPKPSIIDQEAQPGAVPLEKREKHEKHEKHDAQQRDPGAKVIEGNEKAASSASGPRILERTVSLGNLPSNPPALSLPKPDLARPVELHRSQTWSGQHESHSASDTAAVSSNSEHLGKPKKRKTGTGANAKRKEAIKSKLHTSIEAGEMPPFCENCGAIETPTWRKAWVKVHSGKPDHVVISEEEGGIIAWETLQTDIEGTVCLYRIIKRALLPVDQGFSEILLCNPCGLWLHNRKCIRPKEAWERTQKRPDEKRKRPPHAKKSKTDLNSEQNQSDSLLGGNAHSDPSSPVDDINTENEYREVSESAQANKPRASSLQPLSITANTTGANDSTVKNPPREVRSSPPRLNGAVRAPAEASDLATKPTRRLLFPSPKQAKDQRPLGETNLNPNMPSEDVSSKEGHSDCLDYDQSDKENCPPTPIEDLRFDNLFDYSHHFTGRLSTPSPKISANLEHSNIPGDNLATPDRQVPLTGDFFSSAAKLLLLPTTPNRTLSRFQQISPIGGELTPFSLHVNQLLSEANNPGTFEGTSFDLSALPPLNLNLSPSSHPHQDIDLSSFDHSDFLNTDIPIPSSPPWFGVYEDPMEAAGGDIWSDFPLPTISPDKNPLLEVEVEEILEAPFSGDQATRGPSSMVLNEGNA